MSFAKTLLAASLLVAFAASVGAEDECDNEKPHILFILADDLGYNDVPWHNNHVVAPRIKALANEGMRLEQHYTNGLCSPSRAALLTGRYSYTIGRDGGVISPLHPTGLDTNLSIIPNYLKDLGYENHMVGKWHLGFCNERYHPQSRGFDTFHGFYLGAEDFFLYNRTDPVSDPIPGANNDPYIPDYTVEKYGIPFGYDFREGSEIELSPIGTYSTDHYAAYMDSLLASRKDSCQPQFIYFALQSVHWPLQVPDRYSDLYSYIDNEDRRLLLGMVTAMDDLIGSVVDSLKKYGYYDNTLLIFSTDNGGTTHFGGNNWPLRGEKLTLWEGGQRAVSFVHSPLLHESRKGSVSTDMMHVTDWLPTIVSAAGGHVADLPDDLDGINQWQTLSKGKASPRKEFVHHWNGPTFFSAFRREEYKLLMGVTGAGAWTFPPEGTNNGFRSAQEKSNSYSRAAQTDFVKKNERQNAELSECIDELREKMTASRNLDAAKKGLKVLDTVAAKLKTSKRLLSESAQLLSIQEESRQVMDSVSEKRQTVVELACNSLYNTIIDLFCSTYNCNGTPKVQLFNLADDPTETTNLSTTECPKTVELMLRLYYASFSWVKPDMPPFDNAGLPSNWNGVWSPGWC